MFQDTLITRTQFLFYFTDAQFSILSCMLCISMRVQLLGILHDILEKCGVCANVNNLCYAIIISLNICMMQVYLDIITLYSCVLLCSAVFIYLFCILQVTQWIIILSVSIYQYKFLHNKGMEMCVFRVCIVYWDWCSANHGCQGDKWICHKGLSSHLSYCVLTVI